MTQNAHGTEGGDARVRQVAQALNGFVEGGGEVRYMHNT